MLSRTLLIKLVFSIVHMIGKCCCKSRPPPLPSLLSNVDGVKKKTVHRGGEEGKCVILTDFSLRGPSVFTRVVVVDVK